ncbi:homocysteine S-methyltransferase family protein [Pseudaestuariivita sp.]|uniref:homocysteine S-methyltransferase family protein n=1 Tax=Pseudaestuariivita sp. TaxID=2211669 RepID=UPI0040597EDD
MTVTVLDGGMGQELIARTGVTSDLWSLWALMERPEVVRAVHDDFFAAGAEIATTNTYCCLPDRLEPKGHGEKLEALTRLACDLAVRARDAHGAGLVAGALGPQGFSYQADKVPPVTEAAEVYARVARMMEGVDLYLLETMASLEQVEGGLVGTQGLGKPVWVAMTVDDADGTRLRSGEPVVDALPLVERYGAAALLLNCSRPEAVGQGIQALRGAGVPVGAYANGFVGITAEFNDTLATVDMLETRRDLTPEAYLGHARDWARDGATLIGGCCEVGPAHIAALTGAFRGVEA